MPLWFFSSGGGQPVFRKSVSELKDRVQSTRLPFIIKGITSEEDALEAVLNELIRIKQNGM
jgi:hypothetical protein